MIELGSTVKDPITGLEGIAVARSEWLWGCIRVGIQPKELKDGKPVEESWFDEERLVVLKDKEGKKPQKPHGGPDREHHKVTEG